LIALFEALDGEVDRVHVECSDAGQWAERTLLAEVPDSMEVIAGVADVKSAPQDVDELRSRIDDLTSVLPPERLLVSSSCGCGRMPHDDAIALMRNLAEAAHSL
jgi:methionine synthase II (cobalamin-independent)